MSMRKLLRRHPLYNRQLQVEGCSPASVYVGELLRQSTHIRAQNVADYYWALDKDVWKISDFPNLAPPWHLAFIEWREPPHPEFGVTRHTEVGMLVWATEYDQPAKWPAHITPLPGEYLRWGLACLMFAQNTSFPLPVDAGAIWINVSSTGRGMGSGLQENGDGTTQMFPSNLITKTGRDAEDLQMLNALFVMMNVGLMTISFANCSNVPVHQERSGWVPRKPNAKPKHGERPVTWHVLDIGIPKAVLQRHGASTPGTGLKKALHLARGHFKHYTEARPLMGKAVGTYWWKPQIRGKDQSRVALKDYNVEAKS